ncbi:calcium antiporter, partial [Reticulomyxa filosa]
IKKKKKKDQYMTHLWLIVQKGQQRPQSNGVEHITAVRMARKRKMDIALSIAIGSATQVAMFVVAMAVIVGWILGVPMTLDFEEFEVQMFTYTSIILFILISDGVSNWLEGAMLLCLYTSIAVAVWHQEI